MTRHLKTLYVLALVSIAGAFALPTYASTTSIYATAGAWLREDDADTTYNLEASTRLIYDHSTPGYDSPILLKTVLPASLGTITDVVLRLYRTGVESAEAQIQCKETDSFTGTPTWNTAPTETAVCGSTITTGSDGSWYEYDLGEVITWGDTSYNLLRVPAGQTGVKGVYFATFANADQTLRPHILITYTEGVTPTPTPTPTPTGTIAATSTEITETDQLRADMGYYYWTTLFLVMFIGFFIATSRA